MANAIYPLYKQSILKAGADTSLDVNTVQDGPFVKLMTSAYTYSAAHQFFSSLAGTVGTDQRITSPAVDTAGTFSGGNLTYTAVAAGSTITQFGIYRSNAGANTTWRLVALFDTATGLPVATNGGNITITWAGGGIFTI